MEDLVDFADTLIDLYILYMDGAPLMLISIQFSHFILKKNEKWHLGGEVDMKSRINNKFKTFLQFFPLVQNKVETVVEFYCNNTWNDIWVMKLKRNRND